VGAPACSQNPGGGADVLEVARFVFHREKLTPERLGTHTAVAGFFSASFEGGNKTGVGRTRLITFRSGKPRPALVARHGLSDET
jgi:hypothetical protein